MGEYSSSELSATTSSDRALETMFTLSVAREIPRFSVLTVIKSHSENSNYVKMNDYNVITFVFRCCRIIA